VVEAQHLDVVDNAQFVLHDEVSETINVILIEDHTIVREGLMLLLAQLEGVQLQGAAGTGGDGVRLFERLLRQGQAPDVVISDLGLPDFSGIEVTRRIKALCPEVRVLLLSMHVDPEHIAGILEHGVDGYLLKQSSPAELAEGIQAVARGEMALSPAVARRLFHHMQRRIERDETAQAVSEREREVLALLAKGYSSKQIALEFGLSIKTVGNHRTRILEKLGAANTPEAIRLAYELGLITEYGQQ
jgi:two-component system, NarL family, response regulator NreC